MFQCKLNNISLNIPGNEPCSDPQQVLHHQLDISLRFHSLLNIKIRCNCCGMLQGTNCVRSRERACVCVCACVCVVFFPPPIPGSLAAHGMYIYAIVLQFRQTNLNSIDICMKCEISQSVVKCNRKSL